VAAGTSLGRVHLDTRADSLLFKGGTLETTADTTIAATRGFTLDTAGGTISVAPATTLQLDSAITGIGNLTKTGPGVLQLNNVTSNYRGDTTVAQGILQGGGLNALASLSRHIISGGAVSGSLSLNGFDQVIGSLVSSGANPTAASVILGANILTIGNDRTRNAAYAGAIVGTGVVRINGNGAVQTLAFSDNSGQTWGTEVANGILNLALNAKPGSGAILLGIAGVSGLDDYVQLNLSGITGLSNNVTVAAVNNVGSAAISASSSDSSLTGNVTLDRDIIVSAAAGVVLSFEGTVGGSGRITVVDAGTVRLTGANSYGPGVPGTSGSTISAGILIRSGSILLENSAAAGSSDIAMGDITSTVGTVDRATFTSILGNGSFNPNGDGVSETSGGQDAAGTTGFGAFINVSSTVDGNTYMAGDVGKQILIAGEEENPERNGIYVIVSVSGATMNLVRSDDYETSDQMKYGGQVTVTNGSGAGKIYFMFEENVVVRNEPTREPIRFHEDVVNPNISVLQNTSGLTVANNLVVNATNGSGTVTVGGSGAVTSGTGSFTGTLQLADRSPGAAEIKTVILTSSTSDTAGITYSGVISEADVTPTTGDTLSIEKVGTGIVTLTASNTFRGTTTVSAGTLAISSEENLGGNPDVFHAGQLTLNGGTLATTATMTIDDSNRGITVGAVVGGTIDTAVSTALTVENVIVLTGNLTKTGDGALYINSTTSGSGTVSIGEGTLGGTGAISGATTVQSGAILSVGTVAGDTTTISFNGGLTLAPGSTWLLDLVNGTTNASDSIFTTNLNINGSLLDINQVNGAGAFVPDVSYTIATYSGSFGGGSFANDIGGAITVGGNSWNVDYSNGAITLTAVPEPGTLGLLGLALGGFFVRRIRRRAARGVTETAAAGE